MGPTNKSVLGVNMGKNKFADCLACDAVINQPRKGQLFCSDRCRMAHHRALSNPVGAVVMSFADWLSNIETTAESEQITRAEFARRISRQIHAMPAWNTETGLKRP